jgi:HD superfamily phosphohydrolase
MDKVIRLRLYGEIDHQGVDGDFAWQLYQSEAMTRLRDVSLSSTPSRFAPHGMAASRFEHSVGVGYLARKLTDWREPLKDERLTLLAAALLHDIGSPPFSHIAEIFFWDLTNRTHEQETARLLDGRTELASILTDFKVSPKRVVEIINGRDSFLGPLIAGSIDLDNVDNSIHLLRSLGYDEEPPYHPLKLLKAFRVQNNQVYLSTEYLSEILGWQEGRRSLYSVVHSEPNLSSATMLYRALEYAYKDGYLDVDFFKLGESEAMSHLLYKSGRQAAKLMTSALRWHHYPMIYQELNKDQDPRLVSIYDNWQGRRRFANRIARDLNIKPSDLALYVGRDRGEKTIQLPFIGEHSDQVASIFEDRGGPQRLAIFVNNQHKNLADTKKLNRAVKNAVKDLKEDDDKKHVFF